MKFLKSIIIRSNSWYDNLREVPRLLFFLFVLMPIFIGSQVIATTTGNYYQFCIVIFLFTFWRLIWFSHCDTKSTHR
jgi:hypothetical protein